MSALPIFVELLTVVLLGLVFGSFVTAVSYRVPRRIPWFGKGGESGIDGCRSVCPSCRTKLKPLDLIPVLSWVVQCGACRHCGALIPRSYPLIELGVLAGCLGVYVFYGFTLSAFVLLALVPFLAALLVVDLSFFILPNIFVLITGFLALLRLATGLFILKVWTPSFVVVEYIMGGAAYMALAWGLGAFMSKALKKEALGFGDVKFFAVAGLWLGLSNLATFCIVSGILGVAFALVWKLLKKGRVFPFGPALIVALYVLLLLNGSLFA